MRLDKLIRVQPRAFFPPAITLRHLRKAVSQMLVHIFRITFPVYHLLTSFYINRTRLSIQSQTLPIPKLKSEQVRSRTNFQYRHGEYEPWFTPVLEDFLGKEIPGEVESLLFCVQTGIGVGIIAFCMGRLVERKKWQNDNH